MPEVDTKEREKADRIFDNFNRMKAEKQPFLHMYQNVSYYVRARQNNFTCETTPGQFMTGQIYSSTATQAAHIASSTYIGQLFPSADKTIRIDPPYGLAKRKSSKEVDDYFEEVTRRVRNVFKQPEAGWAVAQDEHMLDLVVFGTSGVEVKDTTGYDRLRVPVRFRAFDAKVACLAENFSGTVDTVYLERQLTVRQLVQEYELKNVSEEVRQAYNSDGGKQRNNKVKVLQAIEPREDDYVNGVGNEGMPYASCHYESKTKHKLMESGFDEISIIVARFYKDKGEIYGRSPCTELLPEIISDDGFAEAIEIAVEKLLDPPVEVFTDAITGGVVNLSAGAVMAKNTPMGARDANMKAVEPVMVVGDITPALEHQKDLKQDINRGLSVDRLLDLNNDTRMTLGEADMRYEFRGDSLASIYNRLINEFYDPIVRRVVNIMFAKGLLGVVKDSDQYFEFVAAGDEPLVIPEQIIKRILKADSEYFDVKFISPAARVLERETLNGMAKVMDTAEKLVNVNPQALDCIDFDAGIREVQYLSGAPSYLVRSADEVAKIRQDRQQAEQAAMQVEQDKQQSDAARSKGQAMQAVSQALSNGNGKQG